MLSDPVCDPNGWYIILNIEKRGFPYILGNCYVPNNEQDQIKLFKIPFKKKQTRDHLKRLEPDKDLSIILGGDWNLIFTSSLLESDIQFKLCVWWKVYFKK